MAEMHVTIRTPDATRYDGSATLLTGASELGDLQVYPGHVGMTATIGFSRLVVENGEHVESFFVRQGFLHTDPASNRTEVLGLSCEKIEEVDVKSLREYHDFILEKLKNHENLNAYQTKFLEESQAAVETQLKQSENLPPQP